MSTEVVLKNVRLAFPQLWTPTKFNEKSDKAMFRAVLIITPDNPSLPDLRAAIAAEAKALWKDQAKIVIEGLKGNTNKYHFQSGDIPSKAKYDGFPGNFCLTANNATRPRIVDRDGKTPLVEKDGRPYAGCFVNTVVDIGASTKSGNGIYGYLKGIQFVKDGDSFGGGAPLSEDAFESLEDTGGAPAASVGTDDDFGV